MRADWYPIAKKRIWGRNGGSMVGGPPRGVIHETQTKGIPTYNGGSTAPHMTLDRDGTLWQHIPFNVAARSLRNLRGGVQTNRQGSVNIQIEVVAYSDKDDWTTAQIMALMKFFRWAEDNWDIPDDFPHTLEEPRMSPQEWVDFTGWVDHGGIPENIHWDVGTESGVATAFSGILPDMQFVTKDDKGEYVKFWQLVIQAIDPSLLPQFGADGVYGDETVGGVKALVPSSDGLQIQASEAVELMHKFAPPGPQGPAGPPGPEPQGPWVMEIKQSEGR